MKRNAQGLDSALESELWKRATTGDRTAIEAVLRAHEEQIYRFGLRLCGDEEAAKEVLQRTLVAAFENIHSFRGEARPSTWLYALARSACSRYHRGSGSTPLHDIPIEDAADKLASELHDPGEHAHRAELAALVTSAIGLLPPDAREVVVLRDVEGLPAEEAAKVLGLAIPALKSRLHRARAQLRLNLVTLLREEGGSVGGAKACPELARELEELGSRDLDQKACHSIEEHVSECEVCNKTLGGLRDAVSLCRRLPGNSVPEPVERAVRAALRDAMDRAVPSQP